jgi:hypothetical protein
MNIEDQLGILIGAAEEQEKTAKGSIAALSVAVKELKTTSETLKTGVERAISDNMGKVVLTTEKAVLEASRASVERLNAASAAVASAQREFSMLWIFVPAAVILGFALLAAALFWAMTDSSLRVLSEARAVIAELEAKGGKAKLTTCGVKRRLCIQVDKTDEFKDGYMIIKGY